MWSVKQLVEPTNALMYDVFQSSSSLVPLKSLRISFLENLFQNASVNCICAGEILFDKNTQGKSHLYLHHGRVELQFSSGHSQILLAEQTVLPIAHSVSEPCLARALDDCTIFKVDSDRLDQLLSWSQITEYLMSELSMKRELDDDIEWMQTVLRSNLFYKVPPVNAETIFSKLLPMEVQENEVIIEQSDVGDCCYFVKEGKACIWRTDDTSKNLEKVAEINTGRCFGEDALVNDTVRNASVIMASDGTLMRLEKSDFLTLFKEPAVDELDRDDIAGLVEEPVYIDVRTDDEYSFGHLAYSANIPLSLLSIKKRLLAPEQPYIFYCDTGCRSRAAAYLLGKQGYNAYAMRNGYHGQGLNDCLVTEKGYILRDGILVKGQ